MIFHENRLLADDSHAISYHIFFEKMTQNLSSAAVVIGALRVKAIMSVKMNILHPSQIISNKQMILT